MSANNNSLIEMKGIKKVFYYGEEATDDDLEEVHDEAVHRPSNGVCGIGVA